MVTLQNKDGSPLHPAVNYMCEKMPRREIDRRGFLRTIAWLGVSVSSARAFLELPTEAHAQPVKIGGRLRFACAIQEISDPALAAWTEGANLYRNCLEFLTEVDADNITHPYRAESWKPSPDLTVWEFKLRKGIRWSNGDAFTSEDVRFNVERWTSKNSKSSNRTAFAAISDFETIDTHTFRLHLNRPVASLPEQFYAYTCPILHRTFDDTGANWPKNPLGTGPFTMTDFRVGRHAIFRRREGYWGTPAFLDEIQYIDMGTDLAAQVAALAAGQADVLYRLTPSELDLLAKLPHAKLLEENSAQTLVLRMQVDQKPFDDIRVRRAIVLAADNQRMLSIAYRGMGIPGANHHVAPMHPEYFPVPPLKRDVAQARSLLAEAGYANGLDLTLTLGNTQGKWEQDTAQILQQNVAEAGIRIKLNVLPAAQYWPVWDKAPFALTAWAHRPLAIMTLDLAYRSGAAWNESHFSDAEFDRALDQALATLLPAERSKTMETVERRLQDSAVMVQPYFARNLAAASANVQGHRAHPSQYYRMDRVWLN